MEDTQTQPLKKKSNKCYLCKKKSVINITCTKCSNIFCIKHRCPEIHNCQHEHKKELKVADKIVPCKIEVI